MSDKYHYRLSRLSGGSDKYGPCEVCNTESDPIYYQVESLEYERILGDRESIGLTHYSCDSYTGHKSCLEGKRR